MMSLRFDALVVSLFALAAALIAPALAHAQELPEAWIQAEGALNQGVGAPTPAIGAVQETPAAGPPPAWARGRVPVARLERLQAEVVSLLDGVSGVLERRDPVEAERLLGALDASIASIVEVARWELPEETRQPAGRSCFQQGPWADRVFYVTEYQQVATQKERPAISDAESAIAVALSLLRRAVQYGMSKPGPLSQQTIPTSRSTLERVQVDHSLGPIHWQKDNWVRKPVFEPLPAYLEERARWTREGFSQLIALARKAQADGLTPTVVRRSYEDRYRPRDGERPPVSGRDCPHNGVY
ncbi:MAG: hypothetical protein HY554_19535 [Elusimicrobia bacterium]|nr:hypothetical protein [Elusimicrobiota bacterium]